MSVPAPVGLARLVWPAIVAFTSTAVAQYAPPADYYATVTGNPATMKAELRLIIADDYWTSLTGTGGKFAPNGSGHVVRSYDDLRQGLGVVDSDPANPGKIVLAYSGAIVSGTWDSGNTWNREHRWPDSRGLGGSGPDYSDMHHLTACDDVINSTRGNSPFGTPSATGGYGVRGSFWYPGDNDQAAKPEYGNDTGDVARALFYMAVRYNGSESSTVDLELVNGTPGTNQMGDLAALLVWHYRDLPSTLERRRNHLIFSKTDNPAHYQGNRNPFIDHPEYVWAIFGDGANDSKLYVGASAPANGVSAVTVNFGSVAVGAALPAGQPVTLNKAGGDPTCYEVTVAGNATCSASGPDNAFEGGTGSRVLTVGLPAGITATAGLKTGTITINNLDLTNQGTGTGSLDGDDVISVVIDVLNPNCPDPFADSDRDGDVDQTDFATLQLCYSAGAYSADCVCFDRDGNGAVDTADFDRFLGCLTAPGRPALASCDN
jgi:endonuclease I